MPSGSSFSSHFSPEGAAWHARFVAALESRDTASYLSFLHTECTLQINNALPIYSKAAIEPAYTAYRNAFRSLNVQHLATYGDDDHMAAEALLHHTCNDGSREVIQTVYLLDRDRDGLITSVRVYGNASRLLKPFIRATK